MEIFFDILVFSIRDAFVQVSAFVAVTVLLFSYVQYKTGGRLIEFLEQNEHFQPVAGGLLGLTPGCGGAIVVMPLYVRGKVSFGTVVATLCATAGDSAFVILAAAPVAASYAYGIAFFAGLLFGYAIDTWGLGTARLDRAVEQIGVTVNGRGFSTTSVAEMTPSQPNVERNWREEAPEAKFFRFQGPSSPSGLEIISHWAHLAWWVVAGTGLVAGVEYLRRGAPDVEMELGLNFFGFFTVSGLIGAGLSFFLYFIGGKYIREEGGRIRESFANTYDTLVHAAMETSMVTVWVVAAYLIYEYTVVLFALNIKALAAAAGIFAPLASVGLGIVPGCGPQIVFAGLYANGQIPFSALVGNAISQDGDALFPLMAIDMKAAIIATIYTTIPAFIVSLLVYYVWPFAEFGFGVMQ